MTEKDIFDEMLGEGPKRKKEAKAEEEKAEASEEAEEEVEELEATEVTEPETREKAEEVEEADSREDETEIQETSDEELEEEAEPDADLEEEAEPEEEIDENSLEEAISEEFDEEEEELDKEKLKKEILEKAEVESRKVKAKLPCAIPLNFLAEEKDNKVFIGRSKSVFQKYGQEGALHIGRVGETERFNQEVLLDSLNPHVIFVCGARGSGKSYVLGVIAEELALKNKNVGVIVIDPIGVFWSMKFPNKEEREVKILGEWGLEPCGLDNLKVFVPKGISSIPATTYDATFAVQPSLLTGEDWCLTFGIERFSPTGLLLEKSLRKVSKGYKTEKGEKVAGKGKNYSLEDMIRCLEYDVELNSRTRGFKPDSIRALVSRFDAAKSWGIFDVKGTPLSELSRENQLSIIDTSFLDDAVTALVVGLFARRLLSARKVSTRKEAAQKIKSLNVDELIEMDVPPTWLFIDEAHTLIPSGNVKTPATHALVEYVKQGRRPGCSLVFATQQPSAIDTRVLSQLDLILTHKLVFDDDVKAVFKRTPTIIPAKYKKSTFIKTLPVGVALTGDRREETSRAFILKIRPRFSQHEGRDAVTLQSSIDLTEDQAMRIISGLIAKKIEREEKVAKKELVEWVASLNNKYGSKIKPEDVFKKLEESFAVEKDFIALEKEETPLPIEEGREEEEMVSGQEAGEEGPLEPSEEGLLEETELLAFPVRIGEEKARGMANKIRQKKILGFFGKEELLESLQLKYRLLWKVQLDLFVKKNEFISRDCFIDSVTGEFVHFDKGAFLESKGLPRIMELKPDEIKVLRNLKRKRQNLKMIALPTELEEKTVERILERFGAKGFAVQSLNDCKEIEYCLRSDIDLPSSPKNELIDSLKNLPFVQATALGREKEAYSKEQMLKALHLLWPNTLVKKTSEVYWPLWHAQFNLESRRKLAVIDGFTGQRIQ